LGLKLYEQGVISAGSLRINQIGTGPAYKLLNNTDLTVRLALLDGDQVVVTLNLSPQLQLQTLQIGPRTPAYCSAMGKAILSKLPQEKLKTYLAGTKFRRFTAKTITDPKALLKDLEETRLRGYSLDREEYLIGFTCAGAPIYDHNGQPVAAASISGAPVFLKDERFSDRVHELIQTTNEISRLLGHIPGATASTGR
jgi:DNA-binding IclR family transcriptional regulator